MISGTLPKPPRWVLEVDAMDEQCDIVSGKNLGTFDSVREAMAAVPANAAGFWLISATVRRANTGIA